MGKKTEYPITRLTFLSVSFQALLSKRSYLEKLDILSIMSHNLHFHLSL